MAPTTDASLASLAGEPSGAQASGSQSRKLSGATISTTPDMGKKEGAMANGNQASLASASSSNGTAQASLQPNGLVVNKHTSRAHQPSPLRHSSPLDDGAPLQVKPLRAPPSPLPELKGSRSSNGMRGNGSERHSPLGVTRKPLPPDTRGEGTLSRSRSVSHGKRADVNGSSRTRKASAKVGGTVSPPGASLMSTSSPPSPRSNGTRIRRGQKLEDIQAVQSRPLPTFSEIESPFQVQEYIALLVQHDPHNVQRIVSLPQISSEHSLAAAARSSSPTISFKGKHRQEAGEDVGSAGSSSDTGVFMGSEEEPVPSIDSDIWVYEQLRRIVLDFSSPWLTALQRDCDRNSRPDTCDAMNAEEWMYLCASHGEEKQCCAIDYVIHTLDGTTALLNSHRHFPSRTYVPSTSLRHFGSISRRLSRIFVHAHEHHRDVFMACEAETSLYARFIALVEAFDLIAVDALPKLSGKSAKTEDISAAEDAEGSVASPISVRKKDLDATEQEGNAVPDDIDFAPREISSAGRRTLFDAGTSKEEDDENDEEGGHDEQEQEKNGKAESKRADENKEAVDNSAEGKAQAKPGSEVAAVTRADSNASQITAVPRLTDAGTARLPTSGADKDGSGADVESTKANANA